MSSPVEFVVEPADRADIPVLVDFIMQEAVESEGRVPDRDTITRGISAAFEDSRLARYWKLIHSPSGKIVGSTSATMEWSDWNAGHYWWIQSIFIANEFRGKGLIAVLLARLEEEARRQGAIELRLYVHSRNSSAIRAYEKTAFADTPYKIMSKRL
jgi:GNAT superfamily N-acetyltransferase